MRADCKQYLACFKKVRMRLSVKITSPPLCGFACGAASLWRSCTQSHGEVYPIGLLARFCGTSVGSNPPAFRTFVISAANCLDSASKKLPCTKTLPFGLSCSALINWAFWSAVMWRGWQAATSFSSANFIQQHAHWPLQRLH